MSSKRKDLSLWEKIKVIEYANENKCTQSQLAKIFDISQAQVSKLLSNKEKIINDWALNKNPNQKRRRTGKESDIEDELLEWFYEKRACSVPINGLLLKEKAEDLARKLNISNFKATNGWLCRWKDRNQISLKRNHGEASHADSVNFWRTNILPTLLEDYSPSCIYNCDEAILYHEVIPSDRTPIKSEGNIGGKSPKDRYTILCCSNADGSHKMPLFVIGKLENLRYFGGLKSLPVHYKANSSSGMTANLFQEWLLSFDTEVKKMNQKAILFLNNCSTHKVNAKLENVSLYFLPTNTRKILQPMGQGIISLLKGNYKEQVVKNNAPCFDSENGLQNKSYETFEHISVLTAIHMMNNSWNNISPESIKNCFIKCNFYPTNENTNEIITPDLPTEEMISSSSVTSDNDSGQFGHVLKEEILESEINNNDNTNYVNKIPTHMEIINACSIIRRFLESKSNADFNSYNKLVNEIAHLLHSEKK